MGKSFKENRSGHGKINKKHPHKENRFYKDEFHERRGDKPFKQKGRRGRDIDGFDL